MSNFKIQGKAPFSPSDVHGSAFQLGTLMYASH